MRHALLAACLIAAAAPDAAPAQEADADFDARVRAYLLENPEVILEALDILEERRAAAAAESDADLVAAHADALFRDGFSEVFGAPDGDVTIVEFADYRCGYCKAAHPQVTELLKSDPGVRLIYKEFPILGQDSMLASRVAMAVQALDRAAYARLHEAMLAHKGALDEAAIWRLAEGAGVDVAAVRAGLDAPEIAERIRATYALAQALKVEGTPTFVVGDRIVRGFVEVDRLREMVAEARKARG